MSTQFKNMLLSNRAHLNPQESMQSVINYALLQDARSRSRFARNVKVNWILPVLITAYPVYYVIKGAIVGCWADLHPDNKIQYTFATVGRPYRSIFRPEIYLRDKQAALYKLDKENIEKEKVGQQPTVNSPIVLWQ